MGWCSSVSLAVIVVFVFFYINLLAHRSAIKADPPSQRMSWENCRAVPSHLVASIGFCCPFALLWGEEGGLRCYVARGGGDSHIKMMGGGGASRTL